MVLPGGLAKNADDLVVVGMVEQQAAHAPLPEFTEFGARRGIGRAGQAQRQQALHAQIAGHALGMRGDRDGRRGGEEVGELTHGRLL